ncbi:hypothetical protein M422DRAFT_37289 [Sphaerobolus stellatus SS14]|uniref:Aminoglycoside phosphotransferase domain-containing protein n=1 Tax=Sphaerobolus stellatus (strain SS14) TaxID=990650 RepID=A0A0C9UTD4_SPHS4|nr:hypothetical protein M422DRAFT_37289 [Sphaerobolus stellatus SS14]
MSSASSGSIPLSPHEKLWNETNPVVDALDTIVAQYFLADNLQRTSLGDGAYGRAFLYNLNNGHQAVAKVILPVRPVFKTEGEVGAMLLVKEKTSIPVPDVYLYCSSANNPVRAEWIIMQYLPGKRFIDCFEDLPAEKRYQTATDLARIISSIFTITASYCGSVLPDNRLNPLRYPGLPLSNRSKTGLETLKWEQKDDIHSGFLQAGVMDPLSGLSIGPINDAVLLYYPNQIPHEQCGPFSSEKECLVAFLSLTFPRPTGILERDSVARLLEVLDLAKKHEQRRFSLLNTEVFHFAHGDLHAANILIDPATGAVTGIIDWEMAGFRPAWLAAVASEWFNDDRRYFATEEARSLSECSLDNESFEDQRLRAFFRLQMWKNNELLFRCNWLGRESRGFFGCGCNSKDWWAESWLLVYEERFWETSRRGSFPFDITTWLLWRMEQHKLLDTPPTPTSPTDKPSTPMSPTDNP